MKYFHISCNNLNNKIFKPRIPDKRMEGEDGKVKRICVSTSITGCIRAITDIYELNYHANDLCYYVHVPVNYNGKVIRPTKTMVPDVHVTKEKWLTSKTRMRCIGKIKIYVIHKPDAYYSNGSHSFGYRWIEKYN